MAGSDFSRIATNIAALQSLNSLNHVNTQLGIRQLRLATGKRINSASDDAAGLTIATKFDLKAKGLGQALANIADAKSLMAVAEGHLNNINDILGVMRTKAEQAANDTLGDDEREAILDELAKLNDQIDSEVDQARWGSRDLFGNTDVEFQIGYEKQNNADRMSFNIYDVNGHSFRSADLGVVAGDTAASLSYLETGTSYFDETVSVASVAGGSTELSSGRYFAKVTTSTSGADWVATLNVYDSTTLATVVEGVTATISAGAATLDTGVGFQVAISSVATSGDGQTETYELNYVRSGHSVSNQTYARNFMTAVDQAVSKVSRALSYIGAMANRLDYQEASVSVAKVNTEAAYNRIMNADMASEQVEATKYQILQQTAITMLAQANLQPQSILSLFR